MSVLSNLSFCYNNKALKKWTNINEMVSANVEYSYMLALDTDNLERHKKGGQDEFQNSVSERS